MKNVAADLGSTLRGAILRRLWFSVGRQNVRAVYNLTKAEGLESPRRKLWTVYALSEPNFQVRET